MKGRSQVARETGQAWPVARSLVPPQVPATLGFMNASPSLSLAEWTVLIKLALIDRAGTDATGLLRRQKAILQPIATERPQRKGFDAPLLAWRRTTAAAGLSFLDDITPS